MRKLQILALLLSAICRSAPRTSAFPAISSTPNGIQFVDGQIHPHTSAGIQDAVTAIPSGGTVFLTCGSYAMTATVTISKPVRVLMDSCVNLIWKAAASSTGMFNILTGADGTTFSGMMGGYSQPVNLGPASAISITPSTGPMDVFVIGDNSHAISGLKFEDFFIIPGNGNVRDIFRKNAPGAADYWHRVIANTFSTSYFTAGYFIDDTLIGASSLENNAHVVDQCQGWYLGGAIKDGTNWVSPTISNNRWTYMPGSALNLQHSSNANIYGGDISQVNTMTATGAINIGGVSENPHIHDIHFEGNGAAGSGSADIVLSGPLQIFSIDSVKFLGTADGAPKAIIINTTNPTEGRIASDEFIGQSVAAIDTTGATNTAICDGGNNLFIGPGVEFVGGLSFIQSCIFKGGVATNGWFEAFANGFLSGQSSAAVCGADSSSILECSYNNGIPGLVPIAPRLPMFTTSPTISSGFGTHATILNPNGTAAFQIKVGADGIASSGTIGFPATAHGWSLHCDDITTSNVSVFLTKQTAFTRTSATIQNFNTAGAGTAWVANDVLNCQASAF